MKQKCKSRKRRMSSEIAQANAQRFSIPVSRFEVCMESRIGPRDKVGMESLTKARTLKGNILHKRIKQKHKVQK